MFFASKIMDVIYMCCVSNASIFYMKCRICSFFVFLEMGNDLSRRGYLGVQSHAWILTVEMYFWLICIFKYYCTYSN
jgi:hypothetical protein